MSWQQIISPIYGSQQTVYTGMAGAMSTDGTTLIVSSVNDFQSNTASAGSNINYYKKGINNWQLQTTIFINNALIDTIRTSSDGNTITITYNTFGDSKDYYINVYKFQNTSLNLIYTIQTNDIDYIQLSRDGSIFVRSDYGYNNYTGMIYIYSIQGQTVQQIATQSGSQAGEWFGKTTSLSTDGSVIAVTSNYDDSRYNGLDSAVKGRVTIFSRNQSTLTPIQTITETTTNYFDGVNAVLSADSSILLIGRSNYNNTMGRIETYLKTGSQYVKQSYTIDGTASNNFVGKQMILSDDGDMLSVFYEAETSPINQPTSFKFYEKSQTGEWIDLQMSIDNLNVHIQKADLFMNISKNNTEITFTYGDPLYNNNNSQGAVYTLTWALQNVPCFPKGTKIQTTTGSVPVEQLTSSHKIVTSDGRAVPFKLYKTEISKTTKNTAPYAISAHTFAHNSPAADVVLSPLHAIQIRPGLWHIPKYAVKQYNSIKQINLGEQMTYYHIELPNYFTDNIVAEGTIVESYAANQTKDLQTVYKYNSNLNGFTRVSPYQNKHISR